MTKESSTLNGESTVFWIKDLNIRHENIKLLKENIREKALDTGLGSNFLAMTSKAQATKKLTRRIASN